MSFPCTVLCALSVAAALPVSLNLTCMWEKDHALLTRLKLDLYVEKRQQCDTWQCTLKIEPSMGVGFFLAR